jgi:phytoene dehydrogenase-like protein
LLLRAVADAHPVGSAAFPRGGLGDFSRALAEAAKNAGAEIRTGTEVAHIRTKDGAVTGIVLSNGEEIACEAVVSGVDPKRTFFHLLDPTDLDPVFALRIKNFRSRGNVAKVHLALGDLPRFPALANAVAPDGFQEALAGRIHIGHEIDYLEKAFDASKYGEISSAPYLDVTIPTILDPSLAPPGKHVLSAYFQFAPYQLREGNWHERRGELVNAVLKTLGAYSPDLGNLVEAAHVVTPLDLEQCYGFTGGHIFHGELALDQLYAMRPLLGWARYRTPIRGLYLCGCGTHPGSGLTGLSGANAAREILRDLKR